MRTLALIASFLIVSISTVVIWLFVVVKPSYAIVDPLIKDNNFFGIHILFPQELPSAARLVNSSGGEWGYVTIPIQIDDRNIEKWQEFLDQSYTYKLIPIIRLATEPLYRQTDVWRKPDEYDVFDFANFLNSLNWPTKNRYVILFNETNRFDEWGGEPPDPESYADLVVFSYDAFKRRNEDFYIILGGLDNAAPNDRVKHLNSFEYLRRMKQHRSDIFNKIDGFASHSYPNPNFAAAPTTQNRMSVVTYRFEYDFINQGLDSKKKAFITETGWNNTAVASSQIASHYTYTLNEIWGKDTDKLVAVTPFLLESQNNIFDKFSFLRNGAPTEYFSVVEQYPKRRGDPEIVYRPFAQPKPQLKRGSILGVREFSEYRPIKLQVQVADVSPVLRYLAKTLLGL